MDEIFENEPVTMDSIEEDKNEPIEEMKQQSGFWRSVFSWFDDLALFFTAFILILSFIGRPVIVDGSSMYPTLKHNDIVILHSAFYSPKKGDIVVVTSPTRPNDPIVKRVIGTAGDVIEVDYDLNTVTVNGVVLDESYINHEDYDILENHGLEDFSYPYTVPEGKIFCMGDNRNNSRDSRDMQIYGALDKGNVLGKVFFRIHGESDNYSEGEKIFRWVD